MISRPILDDIRSKVDLQDFLEKRGTTFRNAGRNLVALCPVHDERSPSFNLRPETQRFHCFGCGIEGDIFNLVEIIEGLSFFGAVQYLADELNIQIVNDEEDEKYKKTKRLYEICSIASAWYRHEFKRIKDDHPGKKNFSDRNLLERAKSDPMIGFAPDGGLLTILAKAGYTKAEMCDAGIAKASDEHPLEAPVTEKTEIRERFKNRIMWTICDISGKPIGFSGRRIYDTNTKAPKYLNSPATPLYNKSTVLLGLQDAKQEIVREQKVYIVEGQTDVMALQAIGVMNVVATCGTAFGGLHASVLQRLAKTGKSSERFTYMFGFDPDAAGIKAASSVITNIPTIQLHSNVITMVPKDENNKIIPVYDEEGKTVNLDPCDLRLKFGDEMLKKALNSSVSLIEFILLQEKSKWDMSTPEGRTGFTQSAKGHISHVKDPLQYDSYLRKIASWSGVPYSQITQVLKQQPVRNQQNTDAAAAQSSAITAEDRIVAFLIQYPQETKAVFEKHNVTPDLFEDQTKVLTAYQSPESENRLAYYDLEAPEDRITQTVEHLIKNYLKARYMEETAQLNARLASTNSGSDENFLMEMMTEQLALKKKFSQ